MKTRTSTILALAVGMSMAALGACSRSGPGELLETAQFEELQANLPHAKELYREILERHPDSPEARKARARLAAIDGTSPSK